MTIGYQTMIHLQSRDYCPTWYVSELPGNGGVDWGWTDKRDKAIHLTPFWESRFKKYGRDCGWKNYGVRNDL